MDLPEMSWSRATRLERSGSSPYQKIHSSLLECSDRVEFGSVTAGGADEDAGGIIGRCCCCCCWKPPPMAAACIGSMPKRLPPPGTGGGGGRGACTLRHTHNMSAARHLEKEDRTGSSRGSDDDAYEAFSVYSSLRHLMPHKSVCNMEMTR